MNKFPVIHRMAVVLPATLLVTGCAAERPQPTPDIETMAILSLDTPTGEFGVQANRNDVRIGGNTGMKGGAMAGATLSLTCGPAIIFCMPFFTVSGAMIGGATGNIAGAASEALDLYPAQIEERLALVLQDIDRRRNLSDEMHELVSAAVPAHRQADLPFADNIARVGPEIVELYSHEGSLLALRITALLVIERNNPTAVSHTFTRRYTYETSKMPIEYWLNDSGRPLDEGFSECIRKLSMMMAWDLVPSRG